MTHTYYLPYLWRDDLAAKAAAYMKAAHRPSWEPKWNF
jgi:hypothetical protein